MREVFAILNDKITVNAINGRAEAVSALQELRGAIMGPIRRTEDQLAGAMDALERVERERTMWARCNQRAALESLKTIRRSLRV
jgi:hypothetical protein